MALGGVLAVSDPRYRLAGAKARKPAADTAAAIA
jgi:hypothetical protein